MAAGLCSSLMITNSAILKKKKKIAAPARHAYDSRNADPAARVTSIVGSGPWIDRCIRGSMECGRGRERVFRVLVASSKL